MKFKIKLKYLIFMVFLTAVALTVLFRLGESDKEIVHDKPTPMAVQVAAVTKGRLLEWY
jgi:hypothetical protein